MHPLLPPAIAGALPRGSGGPTPQSTGLPGTPTYPPAAPAVKQPEGFAASAAAPFFAAGDAAMQPPAPHAIFGSHAMAFPAGLVPAAPGGAPNLFEFPQMHGGMFGFLPPTAPKTGTSDATSSLPAAQRGPTVYLGHLTQETDDMVIRQLLQECGRVVRWSRTTDPATKKLSTFGFCEFESPLGVIRAVRCLNGLLLDGQALVANCEVQYSTGFEDPVAAGQIQRGPRTMEAWP